MRRSVPCGDAALFPIRSCEPAGGACEATVLTYAIGFVLDVSRLYDESMAVEGPTLIGK